MFTPDQYALLDFGDGRKLERFGDYILDRPSPAAEPMRRTHSELWSDADARFDRTTTDRGQWHMRTELPATWTMRHSAATFELRPTEFGHVGLIAEQAENWDWIETQVRHSLPCKVLNLFAYTGGSTLAAAAAGAEVVHIDAAANVVAWARRNAGLSGLAEHPIRWIAEDAQRFVEREVRRGNTYDAVILDPPSYGHGPRGEVWKIDEHLAPLLSACAELVAGRCRFVLLSCHTPGYDEQWLTQMLFTAFGKGNVRAMPLALTDENGRTLPSGVVARWSQS